MGSRVWPFRVMWRHRSRDHRIRRGHFSISGQWWPCAYLARIQRFNDFGVTSLTFWGYVTSSVTLCDHWTRHTWFPIGGPLEPSVYLAALWRYWAPKIIGSRVWPFGVTWRHRSRDHSTRHMWFPIGGPLKPCVYLAPLRSYKTSKLHLPMLKAKSSLHMRRVTWPVGRGSKMTTYLEFPSPHCLFTIQLLWGYDDD